jgi:predicted O-linked N-acetylglucosamine transferase (SPINDLY family)
MIWPFKARGDREAASACHREGLELLRQNQTGAAIAQLERAARLDPRDPEFLKSLGNAHKSAGDLESAAQCYRRSLRVAPDYLPSLYNLGLVLSELKRFEEAEPCFRRVIEKAPDDTDACYELGLARRKLGRLQEAVAAYRRTLELDPSYSPAHNDLGNIAQDQGRLADAVEHYRAAIRVLPDYAPAYSNLGNALARQGRLAEAVDSYRRAIQLAPDFPDAYLNLAGVYGLQDVRDLAIQCHEKALALAPGNASIRQGLLFEMQYVCDWSRFDELCERQRRSALDQPEQPFSPFPFLSIPSTPEEQLQCARNYARQVQRATAHARAPYRFEAHAKPRLRIGYLSADFHEHATAYLMAELFELHDRERFEIVAYSHGPDDRSATRSRLARSFDRFVDIAALPHAAAADRIHGDGIDILVDLKGYTQHARTEIVALRPAPIQVSYLGYPGTMGADFIDYLIADRFIAPPGHAKHFSEKLVRLPGSYQVNDRRRAVADTPPRRDLELRDGSFVFCCFNQPYKILPRTFAVWARLLQSVPGSVLWLLETNRWATRNLRREAERCGIAPERLVFAPKLPLDRHLARLRAADLFLDTFPYNAHTTASDALWVGVPVVTCSGDTFASRVAGSLLTAVGMPELIAGSLEEYEALALRLARNPAELAELREALSRNRASTPLFDTPAFARHLEAAYRQMWDNYRAGNPPSAIEL